MLVRAPDEKNSINKYSSVTVITVKEFAYQGTFTCECHWVFLKEKWTRYNFPNCLIMETAFFRTFWDKDSAEHNLESTAVATRPGTSM